MGFFGLKKTFACFAFVCLILHSIAIVCIALLSFAILPSEEVKTFLVLTFSNTVRMCRRLRIAFKMIPFSMALRICLRAAYQLQQLQNVKNVQAVKGLYSNFQACFRKSGDCFPVSVLLSLLYLPCWSFIGGGSTPYVSILPKAKGTVREFLFFAGT